MLVTYILSQIRAYLRYRETVRELSRVVIAVLEWHWWPLEIVVNWQDLSGGANVLHS